jgi:hypothetical protein
MSDEMACEANAGQQLIWFKAFSLRSGWSRGGGKTGGGEQVGGVVEALVGGELEDGFADPVWGECGSELLDGGCRVDALSGCVGGHAARAEVCLGCQLWEYGGEGDAEPGALGFGRGVGADESDRGLGAGIAA